MRFARVILGDGEIEQKAGRKIPIFLSHSRDDEMCLPFLDFDSWFIR